MPKKLRPQPPSPPPPSPPARRGSGPLLAGILAVAVLAVGAVWYLRAGDSTAAGSSAAAGQAGAPSAENPAATAAATSEEALPPPANAKFGPHKQDTLPPIQFPAYAPPRPPEVITAAYKFAAEHPEILGYVPCYCGCGKNAGHRGNDDCFVASRAANGDVTSWEPHGMECTVCIDVARTSMQMYASGASVRDIRAAIEKTWSPKYASTKTPTPLPPSKD